MSSLTQKSLSGLLAFVLSFESIISIALISSVSLASVETTFATPSSYSKKAYLQVAPSTLGASLDPSTGNWYMDTPISSVSSGQTYRYVLDMSSASDDMSNYDVAVSDYLALGHTGVTSPRVPTASGWTVLGTPSVGTPTQVASWTHASGAVRNVTDSGVLQWVGGQNKQAGNLSVTTSHQANPLTLTGIQSLAGLDSSTTDGFTSQTLINGSGDVVIFSVSHNNSILIRAANMTNGVYTSTPFLSGTGYTSENNGIILQDTTNRNKIYILRHDNVYTCYDISRNPSHAVTTCTLATFTVSPVSFSPRTSSGAWLPSSTAFAIVADRLYAGVLGTDGDTYLTCTTTAGSLCGEWRVGTGTDFGTSFHKHSTQLTTEKFAFALSNGLQYCIREVASGSLALCDGTALPPTGADITSFARNIGTAGGLFYPPPGDPVRLGWTVFPRVENGSTTGYCYSDKTASYIGNASVCRDLSDALVPTDSPAGPNFHNVVGVIPGSSRVLINHSSTSGYFGPLPTCYDFSTHSTCGNTVNWRQDEYGGSFISPTCYVTMDDGAAYGNISSFALYRYSTGAVGEPIMTRLGTPIGTLTGELYHNGSGYLPTGNMVTNEYSYSQSDVDACNAGGALDIPDPSPTITTVTVKTQDPLGVNTCAPGPETIGWDMLTISALPPGYTSATGTVLDMSGNVIVEYSFSPLIGLSQNISSQVPYATYPQFQVRLDVLGTGSSLSGTVIALTHTSSKGGPQICYDATVTQAMCDTPHPVSSGPLDPLDPWIGSGTWSPNMFRSVSSFSGLTTDTPIVLTSDGTTPVGVSCAPVEVGGNLWYDADHDGIQDASEIFFSGAAIRLLDPLGNTVASGTTDASGGYLFSNISGTNTPSNIYNLFLPSSATGYSIVIDNSAWASTGVLFGYTPTSSLQGGDRTLDSDLTTLSGGVMGTPLTLPAAGSSDLTYDFGVFPDIEIGDRVWNDTNANGIQDSGENNIMNATVELLDAGGAVIASALTDGFGNYTFTSNAMTGSTPSFVSNLPLDLAGSYFVRLAASNFTPGNTLDTAMGWTVSPGSRGSDSTLDSDADITLPTNSPSLGYTTIVLHPFGFATGSGRYLLHDIDFGAYLGFDISLKKYIDTVAPSSDADTSGSGVYEGFGSALTYIIRVSNLGPGQTHGETVVTDTLPSGVTMTSLPSGSGWSCNASGADITCRSTDIVLGSSAYSDISIPVTITAKDAVLTNTALATNLEELPGQTSNNTDPAVSLVVPVVIGDRVWNDTNRNGIQDSGETGIPLVHVSLLDASGAVVATAVTNVSGVYTFSSESGSTSPDGSYLRNAPIIPGANYTVSLDASNFTSGTLSGSYRPSPTGAGTPTTDSDGQPTPTPGVSGVNSLSFSAPPVTALASARTDTSRDFGLYQDFDMRVTKYMSILSGALQDANSPATSSGDANSLGYGDAFLYTVRVTNLGPGPLLGTTYVSDTLPNGVTLDPSFVAPSGWSCSVSGQNILCNTATGALSGASLTDIVFPVHVTLTDAVGAQSLTNTVLVSNSAEISTAHNPANTGNPSNPGNPSDPNAPNPSTPEGQNNTDTAVVSIYPVTVGDRVWNDTNRNGIQDSGESGIASVVIDLSLSGTTIASATTDASGAFLFSSATGASTSSRIYGMLFAPSATGYTLSLRPSNFLSGGVLYGLMPTTALAGSDRTLDSNLTTLSTIALALPAHGGADISYDAGLMTPPPVPSTPTSGPGGGPGPTYVPPTTSTPPSTSQFQQPFVPIGVQTIFQQTPHTPEKSPHIEAFPSLEHYPYGPAGDQSLLPNDRVNGTLATPKNVTVKLLDNGGIKGLTLEPKTGKILFPPKTAPGKYTVSYAITDVSDPSNTAESVAVIIIDRAKPTFVLPKKLLDTGTPITKKGIRIIANFLVATKAMFPSAYGFAHVGDAPRDIAFWKKHLSETLGDKYQEKDNNARTYIVVPSIGIVTPVYDILDSSEKSSQKDFDTLVSGGEINVNPYLHDGVVHYPRSASAGEVGNMVVAGHSSYWNRDAGRYKTVFGNLMELDAGEEVWVYTQSSTEKSGYALHRYRVTASYNTDPTNVSVLLPDGDKKIITLFTCTPVGGLSGRWIVRGELVEEKKES